MAKAPEMFVVVMVMMSLSSAAARVLSAADASYSGKVLLVSMDGFRWDYVNKVSGLGNFTRMRTSGVTVDYVNPTFATKTYPGHYTIATGLYEENHGIVANYMYDPVRNATFHKTRSKESFWFGGQPIWVTAVSQGKQAGVLYWPGGDVEIGGHWPTMWEPNNDSIPFPDRVEKALSWFTDHDMDFVALYFNQPDSVGHYFGPDSPEVAEKVREMDGILGLILDGLETRGLSDVNLILTSDHGMAAIDMQKKLIDLWDVIDASMVDRVVDSGTLTAILPAEGREEDVVAALRNQSHMTVYRKEEIPENFHYKHNPRIMPVIVQTEPGWELSANINITLWWNSKGNHGYNSTLPSMKPIFFARGPDFRKGVNSTFISQVDIYALMCRLLNVKPAPNNGSLLSTAHFLSDADQPTGAAGKVYMHLALVHFMASAFLFLV
ncbi:hypothetical protein BaRGS_00019239 [Batillaria attramentaria]|uniref:Ectonucleotide pyrophosphatase/phosphodiesterase family member 5 n=1 Tax=Batillaria attramentaria TaxID=370345 RepID=A0ABD0KR55_9CAEN